MVTKAKKQARADRIAQGARKKIAPLAESKYWTSVETRLPPDSENVLAVVHWEDDFYQVCQVQYLDEEAVKNHDGSGVTRPGWYEAVVDDYDYEFQRLRVTHWRPLPPLPAAILALLKKRQPRKFRG